MSARVHWLSADEPAIGRVDVLVLCGTTVKRAEFTAEVDGDLQREDLAKIITCRDCRKLTPKGRYICGVVEVRDLHSCSHPSEREEGEGGCLRSALPCR